MVDCVGKELSIGDKVVCADMKYADLLIGEIVGFTPKKARVLYKRSEYGEAYGVKGQKEQLKESYQIFKYEEVVRCKDCQMWKCHGMPFDITTGTCHNPIFHFHHGHVIDECFMPVTNETDFCSYGERKDK